MSNGGERFTGHGSEWVDSNLSADDARTATVWVDQIVNKRSMLTNKDRVEDVRDAMWELEKDGEIIVHRVTDEHEPVTAKTLYGLDKRVPTTQLWHHKSCGQCGNIPGYPASLLWLMNKMDIRYLDETDQTSCTAWNYHGSGIGNIVSLAAVFLRNFHQAYVSAKAQGLPEGYYYPLVHCGTSFGNYKEVRGYLIQSAKLRESVKKILGKLGRLVAAARYRIGIVSGMEPWPDSATGLADEIRDGIRRWERLEDGSLLVDLNARQQEGPQPSVKQLLVALGVAEEQIARIPVVREMLVLQSSHTDRSASRESSEVVIS